MINEKSILAVAASKFSKHFCLPLYDSYCFSRIPATIEALFSEKTSKSLPEDTYYPGPYDHVILLFIDGFGWRFYDKYKSKHPILQKFEEEGIVSKVTSMFPSTTAAHVTCINTGLSPSQAGIYEWFILEPKLNDIIAPLPFSIAGDRENETLPLNPKELFPTETLYQKLNLRGVKCSAFETHSIIDSTYSQAILDGAQRHGYKTLGPAFNQILSTLHGKTYTFFYFGDIDAIGHRKGVHSSEFDLQIEKVFKEIETFISALPPKTAVILTADHGMIEVNPKQTYYLNKKIPHIQKYLQFGRREKPLAPAGSCRDFFLHVHPQSVSELQEVLSHFLRERGEVYKIEELLDAGLFGPEPPSANFLSRVGNLVILPYEGEAVWWYEKNRFQQNFYGAHGGLTRQEMEIPFIFYRS